jgi:membrane-associated phospholipid phosphatase
MRIDSNLLSNHKQLFINNDRNGNYGNYGDYRISPDVYNQRAGREGDSRVGGGDGSGEVTIKKASNANVGRNVEIQTKNETLYTAAQYISNAVSFMYISVLVSFIILQDKKWLYILIIVFIVNIIVVILRVFTMRFSGGFFYRPGKCIDESMVYDLLESNFILDGIKKRVNSEDYNVMGIPSVHMTRATTILALTYLFFPKYNKITLIVAPIYLILLSWARIYLDCHTILQVLSGVIMGCGAVYISYKLVK